MLRKLLPLTRQAAHFQLMNVRAVNKHQFHTTVSNYASIYEPDYLHLLQPKFPQYESLNIEIRGYDYPVLESYQKFLHNLAEYLELDVSECYALPPQKTKVQRFRPRSTVIDAEYNLTMYERDLQINNVDAPIYPTFLRIAQAALPEGVSLTVREFTEECAEKRYVPDKDLLDLKAELDKIQFQKK